MKKIAAFILLLVASNVSAQDDAAEDTAATPVITAVGKPAGRKTEIKINKDGGSLKSWDGMAELIFPAGAVSKKTNISIQPITNLMTNGNGMAYRFEPSGIQFQKLVQVIFHYDENETKDRMQLLLGIAMQDAKGQWLSLNKFDLDTVAKTISGNINHFSDWTNFNAIKLYPSSARLKVKKILDMTIDLVSSEGDENLLTPLGGSAGLSPMQKMKIPWRATWRANEIINGNTAVGKIVRQSRNTITYEAPATLPVKNPVAVTADINGLTYKYKGVVFKDLRLVSNILIYDVAYEVTMISEIQHPGAGSNLGAVTYRDTGSFVISLNGKEARIIEKVNKNISSSLDYSGGCCYDYRILKSGTGNIHIAGTPVINVTPVPAPGKSAIIEIIFSRVPSIFPLFQVTCQCPGDRTPTTSTNASGVGMMAGILPAFPQQIKFETKEGEQVILEHGKPGSELYARFTVKQIQED